MRILQGNVTELSNRPSSSESHYAMNFVLDQKTLVMMQPTQPLAIHHNDHIIVGGFFLGRRFMAMAYHNTSTAEKWQNYPWMMGGLGLFLVGFGIYTMFLSFDTNNLISSLAFSIPCTLVGGAFLWYARAIYKTFQKVASYESLDTTAHSR